MSQTFKISYCVNRMGPIPGPLGFMFFGFARNVIYGTIQFDDSSLILTPPPKLQKKKFNLSYAAIDGYYWSKLGNIYIRHHNPDIPKSVFLSGGWFYNYTLKRKLKDIISVLQSHGVKELK